MINRPCVIPSAVYSGSAPGNDDTINIGGSTVVWNKKGGTTFGNSSTIYKLSHSATVSLGNTTATNTTPVSNPRFDGQFNVGAGCTLNVNAMFAYGLSQIDGTVNICNVFDPGDNHSPSFGANGVIRYMEGAMNGLEGNGCTTTISASLHAGIVSAVSEYGLEKR